MNVTILLDPGHGLDTPGKRSPDGSLQEAVYVREIASRVSEALSDFGYTNQIIVPEGKDIPLSERVKRVNTLVKSNPNTLYMLLSIHVNAAGNGKNWMNARGWSVFVSQNCSNYSKQMAGSLALNAEQMGLKVRREYPKLPYWVADYYILKYTKCPAVLTENLFMDNMDDVSYLLSEEGKTKITNIHVYSVLDYFYYE